MPYFKHLIKRTKKIYLPLLLILAVVALVLFSKYKSIRPNTNGSFQTLQALVHFAELGVTKCKVAGSQFRQPCYDDYLTSLMDPPNNLSMEDVFTVTSEVQKRDDSYWYCHVLSHRVAAKEVDKDPNNWQGVLARCPVDICSNGCLHGAFQERFKADTLTDQQLADILPQLKNACENIKDLSKHDRTSCYHGLGHAFMYMTNADLKKSDNLCTQVAIKNDGRNYLQTCVEGTFMQVFQPREPEDVALIKNIVPTKDKASDFCDQFDGQVKAACKRESWVLFKDEIVTPQGLMKYCSYTTEPRENRQCLNKMFYSIMSMKQMSEDFMKSLCVKLPRDIEEHCFADTAGRMITADQALSARAVGICDYAAKFNTANECYSLMSSYSGYIFAPGSKAGEDYCNLFSSDWKGICLSSRK